MAVIQSYFTPITFDEMVKPLQMYGEEFRRQEDLYATLGEDASLWGELLDANLDADAYKMWSDFNLKYNEGLDSLMTHGLKNSRKKLMNARLSYNTNIKPLLEAKTKRDEFIKTRQAIQLQNPDILFKHDNVRIGEFLHGATPDNTTIDVSKEEKRAADYATALGKAFNEIKSSPVGGLYIDIMTRQGLTPEVIQALGNGLYEKQIVDNAVAGIDPKKDSKKYNLAKQRAEAEIAKIKPTVDKLNEYLGSMSNRLTGWENLNDKNYILDRVQQSFALGMGSWQHQILADRSKVDASTIYSGEITKRGQNISYKTSMALIESSDRNAAAARQLEIWKLTQEQKNRPVDKEFAIISALISSGQATLAQDKNGNLIMNDKGIPKITMVTSGKGKEKEKSLSIPGATFYLSNGQIYTQRNYGTEPIDFKEYVLGDLSEYKALPLNATKVLTADKKIKDIPNPILKALKAGDTVYYNAEEDSYYSLANSQAVGNTNNSSYGLVSGQTEEIDLGGY